MNEMYDMYDMFDIVCLSVCLPACLPACLPVCLSVCLFVCTFVCVCICMYACMYVYMHKYTCTHSDVLQTRTSSPSARPRPGFRESKQLPSSGQAAVQKRLKKRSPVIVRFSLARLCPTATPGAPPDRFPAAGCPGVAAQADL